MNINIVESLKIPSLKAPSKAKERDDGESFLKSFNKLLAKNELSKKKTQEDKSVVSKKEDREKEDKTEDVLKSTPPVSFTRFNPREETGVLNVSTEGLSINPVEGVEELGQVLVDQVLPEQMLGKVEGELEGETFSIRSNFNLEEIKANLNKAIKPEGESLELKGENIPLEASLGEEVKLEEESISLGSPIKETKNLDIDSLKITDRFKDGLALEENKLEELDESFDTKKEGLSLESLKSIGVDKESITSTKTTETKELSSTEMRPLDTNFLLNRIQNSFLGLEEVAENLSSENILNIEDSIVKFMKVSKEGDTSLMKVKLYPEELGSIDISLKLHKGKLMADIIVQSEKIKDMFLNSSGLLNRTLEEHNISVKHINVSVNDGFEGFERFSGQANDGKSSGENQQNTNKNMEKDLGNSPMDSMRIEDINKTNKGLNILV